MRKFETIWVKKDGEKKNIQINTEENCVLRIKCGGGDNPHKLGEFSLDLENDRIYCSECGREFPIVEKGWETRAKAEKRAEALANLQVRSAGKCWETGMEYWYLSARVEQEIWGKIAHLFSYFRKGWTRNSEMEFDGFEPSGWLTVKPKEVESILRAEGLIKAENSLSARAEAEAIAKAKAEAKAKAKAEADEIISELFCDENGGEVITGKESRFVQSYHSFFFRQGLRTYAVFNSYILYGMCVFDMDGGRKVPNSKRNLEMLERARSLFEQAGEIE